MIVSNMKPLARTGSGWRMEGVGGVHESTGTSEFETSFSSLGWVGDWMSSRISPEELEHRKRGGVLGFFEPLCLSFEALEVRCILSWI